MIYLLKNETHIIEGDYFDFPAISSSRLKKWIQSPAHFKEDLKKEPTDAMQKGTALHTYILEPLLFDEMYQVFEKPYPESSMNKRENKEARSGIIENGKIPISPDFAHDLSLINAKIQNHDIISACLSGDGENELGLTWIHESGIRCKIKPDRLKYTKAGILPVDLKKCQDASRNGFMKACKNYHYPLQAAFYMMGIKEGFGVDAQPFHFIMIEEKYPFYIQHYTIEDWQINVIQQWIDKTLFDIQDMIQNNSEFHSYSNPNKNNGGLIQIELPDYYLNTFLP